VDQHDLDRAIAKAMVAHPVEAFYHIEGHAVDIEEGDGTPGGLEGRGVDKQRPEEARGPREDRAEYKLHHVYEEHAGWDLKARERRQ
jgi:hypothetical protein